MVGGCCGTGTVEAIIGGCGCTVVVAAVFSDTSTVVSGLVPRATVHKHDFVNAVMC